MQQVPVAYAPSVSSGSRIVPLRGEVSFESEHAQERRTVELLGEGALVVRLPPPTSHVRGHLGSLLEELVERELARAGAPSPYLAAWTAMPDEATARLADQLLRAQAVGASGLAIGLGSLRAIALPSLCPDDSAVLRWLAESTTALPLVLMLDDGDIAVNAYAAPRRLDELLATMTTIAPPPIVLSGDDATAIENVVVSIDVVEAIITPEPVSAEPFALAPSVCVAEPIVEERGPLPRPRARRTSVEVPAAVVESVRAHAEATMPSAEARVETRDDDAPRTEPDPAPEAKAPADATIHVDANAETRRARGRTAAAAVTDERSAAATPEANVSTETRAPEENVSEQAASSITTTDAGRGRRRGRGVTVGVPEATATNDAWRACALALSAARGPQPLAAFERLFAESYVPLANAIAGGVDDPRALRAFDEFRRSFERSYTDAFSAFGATNRRPRLVMDAFDLASKQARLVGARSAHVLLVDSLRFDLGTMMRDALAREATGVATLGSETILWSALPTTTIRQLETLARGMDALRAPAPEDATESLRGRAAEVVRRLRVGSREIYKLDLVPALLDAAGANAIHELPTIAQSVAEAIARHVTTIAPRTLLFIVGDHGFTMDRRGQIQSGGASPEEVLVPAQSWLIGDLH